MDFSEYQNPLDVEFLPLVLVHNIHRDRQSSQVEIVQKQYYQRELTPEPEPEVEGEIELEAEPPAVVYAPPLKALKEKRNWWDFHKPTYAHPVAYKITFNSKDGKTRLRNHDSDQLWWTTLDILAGKDEKRRRREIQVDLEDWLAKIRSNFEEQYEKRRRKNSKMKKKKNGSDEREVFNEVVEFECTFNNPAIRSRLELLMGSNVVRITDRKYMMKLQERIREDHLENLKKRIQEREADEVEREKKLILCGKIPLDEAPKELKNHPICRINELAKKILEEKRAKMKVIVKSDLYKTPYKRIKELEKLEKETEMEMEEEEFAESESSSGLRMLDSDISNDINKGFRFNQEEYDRLRYEAPLVKVLKEIDSVEEMYKLADKIVGPLK